MLYYAKSTNGFYDEAIHSNAIPADAVEITSDEHLALLSAQTAGKAITANANGRPIAVDPRTLMTLAQVRAAQITAISGECQAKILGGFISSALGSAYTYPSSDTDQRNLLSASLAAQGQPSAWKTPMWCADAGNWSLVDHSAAQVLQVNADWLTHRVTQQEKYAGLVDQINAATTLEAVQEVVW